jgi:hypothetical protein
MRRDSGDSQAVASRGNGNDADTVVMLAAAERGAGPRPITSIADSAQRSDINGRAPSALTSTANPRR